MRTSLFLIALIFYLSCTKDNGTVFSYGTKLVTIEYSGLDNWIENYFYNSDSLLIRMFTTSTDRRYELEYEEGRLKQYTTFDNDDQKIIFRDSILYNENGDVEKIYDYSINGGANLPLFWVYEYEYDSAGKVMEKKTLDIKSNKYYGFEKYHWKDNNIEQEDQYSEDSLLQYSFFYTYDNKHNYDKNKPTLIEDPLNWSNNNITKVVAKDFVGNLDLVCNPVESTFQYNLDGFPVKIRTNCDLKVKLKYE